MTSWGDNGGNGYSPHGYSEPYSPHRGDGYSPHRGDGYSPHGYGSTRIPRSSRREFFLNVTLSEHDLRHHASSSAQEYGGFKYGQAGALLGGLLGTVTGGLAIPHSVITNEVSLGITQAVKALFMRDGWHVDVTPMKLPSQNGEWQNYIPRGHGGHFMVFRVYFVEASSSSRGSYSGNPLTRCCLAACPTTIAAPNYNKSNSQLIEQHIDSALQMNRPPIRAIIEIANAEEEAHVLQSTAGLSREIACQAVNNAQTQAGFSRAHDNSPYTHDISIGPRDHSPGAITPASGHPNGGYHGHDNYGSGINYGAR